MTATELIYTTADKTDYGTIQNPTLDYEHGTADDTNTFELTQPLNGVVIRKNAYVYISGTDYLGQVTSMEPSSEDGTMIYSGPTWQGLLDQRVICPDTGEEYLTLSGDANTVIGTIIERVGLSSIMAASSETSGITVSHKCRYVTAYSALMDMLSDYSARLTCMVSDGKAIVSAEPVTDWSTDSQLDGEQFGVDLSVDYRPVNHLICLGSGEGVDRIRYDLYADSSGNISTVQTITGEDLHEAIYDYTSADLDTLESNGPDQLQTYLDAAVTIAVTVETNTLDFGIGDTIGAYIGETGMSGTAILTKKVVKMERGKSTITYTSGSSSASSITDLRSDLTDQALAAINAALEAAKAASSKTQTYSGTDYPTSANAGDIFINTATNVVYRANASY